MAGDEQVGGPGRIEVGERGLVGGLDGEEAGAVDSDRPAAPKRVDRAGDVAPAAQIANSVTSGTWSEGRVQLRHGSWTTWLTAWRATSGVAHI